MIKPDCRHLGPESESSALAISCELCEYALACMGVHGVWWGANTDCLTAAAEEPLWSAFLNG